MKFQKKEIITFVLQQFIDSVLKIDKKNYRQAYLERCKYKMKKRELVNFIDDDLSSDDSDKSDV